MAKLQGVFPGIEEAQSWKAIVLVSQKWADSLDSLVAPVVAHELSLASTKGLLVGENGLDRYRSFFSNGKGRVQSFWELYPILSKRLETFIGNSKTFLVSCLDKLLQDLPDLLHNGLLHGDVPSSMIQEILLMDSDPHHSAECVVLFKFTNNEQVIYKPRGAGCAAIFSSTCSLLELEHLCHRVVIPSSVRKPFLRRSHQLSC